MRLRVRTLNRNRGRRRVDHEFVTWRRTDSSRFMLTRLTRGMRSVLRMPAFRAFLVRGLLHRLSRLTLHRFPDTLPMRRRLRLRAMGRRWRGGPCRHCRRCKPGCCNHHHHCPHAAPPSMSRCSLDSTGQRLYPTCIGPIRLPQRRNSQGNAISAACMARAACTEIDHCRGVIASTMVRRPSGMNAPVSMNICEPILRSSRTGVCPQ